MIGPGSDKNAELVFSSSNIYLVFIGILGHPLFPYRVTDCESIKSLRLLKLSWYMASLAVCAYRSIKYTFRPQVCGSVIHDTCWCSCHLREPNQLTDCESVKKSPRLLKLLRHMASLAVCASRSTKYTFGPWVWHQGQCGGHMLMSGDIDLPYSLLLHIPSIEIGGNEDKFWVGLDRKWSKWRQIWGLVESRPMISCSSDIAPGPGDSANVVVSPSRALYVWLCIWGAFYMCGRLYRCVWYVVGLYGQACQQCGPLANHRLAHNDWSHGPHITSHLGPTDPSGHRRPRF